MELLHDLAAWMTSLANTPYGGAALFALAFAESSFFPLPPDLLLIPLALNNTSLALLFAAVATVGSTLGGMLGYFIGNKGGRPLLERFFNADKVALVQDQYQRYDVWAVGMAAFTPIPYKLFSISAGAFQLDFKRFLLASVLGRGGRFLAVGLVITIFGESVKAFLESYFELAVIAFGLLFIGGFLAIKLLARKRAQHKEGAPDSVPASPSLSPED